MENFEILARYPHSEKVTAGIGELFDEKILVRYKGSDIKDPVVCPRAIFTDIERIKNFKVNEDDVFLIGFPRSGTTLMQEMLWLILHDFDFEQALEVDAYNRAQFFDYFSAVHEFQGVPIDNFEKLDRPRVFKTHLPIQLLPPQIWTKKPKIVFISRNVKDAAVSNFFVRKLYCREVINSMEEHFEDFLNDRIYYGPYREFLKNYQTMRGKSNVLFLTYEEVTSDYGKSIKKVAEFLGKKASEENVKRLVAHLDFKAMKKNPKTNMKSYFEYFNQVSGQNEDPDNFIRKGKVGGYKDEMSEEFEKRFDAWIEEKI